MMSSVGKYLTLERRMQDCHYRPSGFDYMRVFLALGVIFSHSGLISYGLQHERSDGLWGRILLDPVAFVLVPLFFALSGFLVAGSLERSKTLISFFGLRILRIVPALSVEVFLSALFLGPLLTTLPMS